MKDKENPFFKSNYADINNFIELVKPVLNKHNLILLQPLTHIEGQPAIKTIIIDADSDAAVDDITPIITKEQDPQKVGSAVTYYRRYALQSFLFIQAEDDDANKASGKKQLTDDSPFK